MTTRRHFATTSAVIAGGFIVGCRLVPSEWVKGWVDDEPTRLTPYVLVDQDGIRIITPRAEMGQGIHTTLAALVAEELDVALEDIRVEHGPASDEYANEVLYPPPPEGAPVEDIPKQATAAQTSTRDAYVKMRKAGAAARLMLLQAAADRLGVEPDTLTTRTGAVVAAPGHEIPYVELAAAAADIDPPEDPPLKPRAQCTLLGKSLPRLYMPGK